MHSEEGTRDGGLIQVIVYYLLSLGSLLHFDMFGGVVWLIIMAKVCHYGSSQLFSFYSVD
jgi:hypothetical protein